MEVWKRPVTPGAIISVREMGHVTIGAADDDGEISGMMSDDEGEFSAPLQWPGFERDLREERDV